MLKTLLANMKHATQTHQPAIIGGGIYTAAEIKDALEEIEGLIKACTNTLNKAGGYLDATTIALLTDALDKANK